MMRMFVRGVSVVPGSGMQQLAEQTRRPAPGRQHPSRPPGSEGRCAARGQHGRRDRRVPGGRRRDRCGQRRRAARRCLGATEWKGVTTIYHAAPEAPLSTPTLLLDPDDGPINNTVVVSAAAPSYAPAGRALVATSLVHGRQESFDERVVRERLAALHETATGSGSTCATYDVPGACLRCPHRTISASPCGTARSTSAATIATRARSRERWSRVSGPLRPCSPTSACGAAAEQ